MSSIEDVKVQHIAVKENLSEEDELAELSELLEKRGVPLERNERGKGNFRPGGNASSFVAPDDDSDDDSEEPAEEPEPEAEEVAPEPEKPVKAKAPEVKPEADQRLLQRLAQEILESDPGPQTQATKDHFDARENRRMQSVLDDNEKLRASMNVLLEHLNTSKTKQEKPEAVETEDEEEDFFVDPKANVQKLMQPILQKLQQIEQDRSSDKQDREVERIISGEKEYAAANPDYLPSIRAWREGSYNEMVEMGATPEQAKEILVDQDRGMFVMAEKFKRPAWEIAHKLATKFISRTQTAAAPAAPAPKPTPKGRPDGSIAAARAATQSSAAGSISSGSTDDGGTEITAESLLESGASPEDIRRILKESGRDGLMSLLRKVEASADRERRK